MAHVDDGHITRSRSLRGGCGRPMLWAVTAKGKRMPLDPDPDPYGNVLIRPAVGGAIAEVMDASALMTRRGERYTPHIATCPAADEFRAPSATPTPCHLRSLRAAGAAEVWPLHAPRPPAVRALGADTGPCWSPRRRAADMAAASSEGIRCPAAPPPPPAAGGWAPVPPRRRRGGRQPAGPCTRHTGARRGQQHGRWLPMTDASNQRAAAEESSPAWAAADPFLPRGIRPCPLRGCLMVPTHAAVGGRSYSCGPLCSQPDVPATAAAAPIGDVPVVATGGITRVLSVTCSAVVFAAAQLVCGFIYDCNVRPCPSLLKRWPTLSSGSRALTALVTPARPGDVRVLLGRHDPVSAPSLLGHVAFSCVPILAGSLRHMSAVDGRSPDS